MTMIRTEALSFAYRNDKVLHDLTLNFEPGKITALLGPNGSGKSTLLKCCTGILSGYDGEIFIDQQPLHRLPPRQRARYVAYVPQQEIQTFPVSVFDTILMGRKPYIGWMPSRNDYAVIEKIMHQLHLDDIAHRHLNELSGGQRQRVIIARALAQQPQVLLLDEPTANLDLRHQLEVMTILQKIAQDGITIVIAVHDLNLAAAHCHQFVMLHEGRCFAQGTHEIFTPEKIRKLYEVEVRIIENGNQPFIIPASIK
jgi:iron complex transport system ATP-binding protein